VGNEIIFLILAWGGKGKGNGVEVHGSRFKVQGLRFTVGSREDGWGEAGKRGSGETKRETGKLIDQNEGAVGINGCRYELGKVDTDGE